MLTLIARISSYYPNGVQDDIEELAQDNVLLDNIMVEYNMSDQSDKGNIRKWKDPFSQKLCRSKELVFVD
jgi:hypothetical protein